MENKRFVIDVISESLIVAPGKRTDSPGTSADEALQRATALLRFGDRVRTIDQVKRLYAVVMGYAVGSCFTNASKAIFDHTAPFWSIFGHIVCFLTLIALFYLAAERLLDTRYLNIRKKRAPNRLILLFDIMALGLTAVWFVIVSDTLVYESAALRAVSEFRFAVSLATLFFIDAFILLIQLIIIGSERKKHERVITKEESLWNAVMASHAFWIAVNFLFMIVLYPIVRKYYVSAKVPAELARWYNESIFGEYFLTYALPALLTIRFLIDFIVFYPVYYPQDDLPDTEGLFLWPKP